MKGKWIVLSTLAAVAVAFVAGVAIFRDSNKKQVVQVAQDNSAALVRAHAPVFGNAAARVTIVEFLDPACETCRAFYPIVKGMVLSSFGHVRLVVRYAPLHQGSDRAVKILEAARQQGKYWEALERTMASQPQWAAHHNPQPELIWESIADIGLDLAKARTAADSTAFDSLLKQEIADMKALKVRATPGFFVNGTPLDDFGAAQLKALVDRELAKAKGP